MNKIYWVVAVLMLSIVWSCSDDDDWHPQPSRHEKITQELIEILNADAKLKALVEKDLALGKAINPDKNYNPAQDLESLYEFLDWSTTCMPWQCLGKNDYTGIYNRIDQSTGYFWFIFDQPLDELRGKGYYYSTLHYHEPIASWIKSYSKTWGAFLDTKASWNDNYYAIIATDPAFKLGTGVYEDPSNWHTFNEFFARKYKDIDSSCPVGDADVVYPVESWFKGVWPIDENSQLPQSIAVKSTALTSISQLIGEDSRYKDAFAGGTFSHTFLDLDCYHRFHAPVSGKIVEVQKISGYNAGGGITEWDAENKRYVYYNETGFQMIETRARIIIDTPEWGLVAMMPVGMSQICSINIDNDVKVGAEIKKGDELGYFAFGGSDCCLIFQKGVKVAELYAPADGKGGYDLGTVRSNLMRLSK